MASYEKLVRRLINNPQDTPVEDIERVLETEGFKCKHKKGSHRFYTKSGTNIPLAVSAGKVKSYKVREIIEILNLEEKYSDD